MTWIVRTPKRKFGKSLNYTDHSFVTKKEAQNYYHTSPLGSELFQSEHLPLLECSVCHQVKRFEAFSKGDGHGKDFHLCTDCFKILWDSDEKVDI